MLAFNNKLWRDNFSTGVLRRNTKDSGAQLTFITDNNELVVCSVFTSASDRSSHAHVSPGFGAYFTLAAADVTDRRVEL